MAKFNSIITTEPDGLPIMEVGNWAQKKYKLVGKYCDIFTSGMKNKWNLVYLDLFCGPGFVKNKVSGQLLYNSGLIALSLPRKFDYYAFNDLAKENATAMNARIERLFPSTCFRVFNDDSNSIVESMLSSIPEFNNGKGTLIFAFLDPFSLNLEFETVRKLGEHHVDILVLHALQMDARRNHRVYRAGDNDKIERFTGNPNWRQGLNNDDLSPTDFMKLVTENFDISIKKIGYKGAPQKERITNSNGAGIYYLCFYSKHDRGLEFFEKVRRTSNDQYELF